MGESTGRKTVFVGSWNLGSAEPGSGLTSWLAGAAAGADIVALGFQEAHYSPSSQRAARISANGSAALACSAAAAMLHPPALVLLGATSVGYFASSSASSELTCRVHLRSLVHSALELHGHSYRILAQPHLMHMRLLLFARSDTTPPSSLSSTECHSLSCGALGGSIANKGGLLTRLRLHDRTLAFLSCHLAPHTAGLFQRNVQSRTLLEGLHTDCRSIALDVSTDHVFVFGDLNYRSAPPHITRIFSPGLFQFISSPTLLLPCTCSFNTTTSPSLTGTRAPLSKEDFSRAFHNVLYSIEHDRSSLLALDQLRHEMENGWAFAGFEEGNISSIAPTFKRERRSSKRADGYEEEGLRRRYSDMRLPAWTDRVLFKSRAGVRSKLQQLSYNSFSELDSSDHDGIYSLFDLKLNPISEEIAKRRVYVHLYNIELVLEKDRFISLGDLVVNQNDAATLLRAHSFDSEGSVEADVWRKSCEAKMTECDCEFGQAMTWTWPEGITHSVSVPAVESQGLETSSLLDSVHIAISVVLVGSGAILGQSVVPLGSALQSRQAHERKIQVTRYGLHVGNLAIGGLSISSL